MDNTQLRIVYLARAAIHLQKGLACRKYIYLVYAWSAHVLHSTRNTQFVYKTLLSHNIYTHTLYMSSLCTKKNQLSHYLGNDIIQKEAV